MAPRDEWNELVARMGETEPTRNPHFRDFYALAVRDGMVFLRSFRGALGEERIHDLIHDVLEDAETILKAETPRAYFCTVLRRRAISWRRRGDAAVAEMPVETATEHAQASDERRVFALDAVAAMARLSERERRVLVAVALGEDRESIARALGTTRPNIDQIVSRAKKRFQTGAP